MHLVKARQTKKWSIHKVANVLNIDVHHYYRIEVGAIKKVNFVLMCRIASALEIDLNKLYRLENDYLKEETS